MKFSIITATYNSAHGIADCLASVAQQGYDDIERIIVDGCSEDDTLEQIRASGCQVDRLVSEPDDGIYDALNKGIRLAKGDVIGFLHSDDVLAGPDVLSQLNTCFEPDGVDGVYGDLVYVRQDDINRVVRYWKSRPFEPGLLRRGWMPAHPTLYLRRAVYEKHGSFDTGLRIAADYDFILRVMSDPELHFAYLPQLIVKMRTGGVSNRNLANVLRKTREDLIALRRNRVGGVAVVALKNLSKLPQFLIRR